MHTETSDKNDLWHNEVQLLTNPWEGTCWFPAAEHVAFQNDLEERSKADSLTATAYWW